MNQKQIKQEIRRLKKVKKDLRKSSEEYIDVKKRIKSLKLQLNEVEKPSKEKEKIIVDINKLTPNYLIGMVNLRLYTLEQLQKHLLYLQRKKDEIISR